MANFNVELFDSEGFRWDINNQGEINSGGRIDESGSADNSFDAAFEVNGMTPTSTSTTESMNGRQHELFGTLSSGVDISRKIYVPDDFGMVRYFDTFTNNTATPITFDIEYEHNSEASSVDYEVLNDSSGNMVQSNADVYLISHNTTTGTVNGDMNVVGHFFGDGSLLADDLRGYFGGSPGSGGTRADYDGITLQPGDSVSYLFFAQQNNSLAEANEDIEKFLAPDQQALEGLTQDELNQVINYVGLTPNANPDKVVVDLSNYSSASSFGFDSSSNVNFSSFDSSTATSYTWNTTGGGTVTAIGTGIAVDGSGIPVSGQFMKFVFDVDNDGDSDVVITGVDIAHDDLLYTNTTTATSTFWQAVLQMETTIITEDGASANMVVAGDGGDVSGASTVLIAGEDTFDAQDSGNTTVSGDVVDVLSATLVAGDDHFEGPADFAFGDARDIFSSARVFAGDDRFIAGIDFTGDAQVEIFGDVDDIFSGSVVSGGSDFIDYSSVTATVFASGDADSTDGTSVLIGGDDDITSGSGNDFLYGDIRATAGGTVLGGNDTLSGGTGNDILVGDFASLGVALTQAKAGDDLIYGGDGNDTLYGDYASNVSTLSDFGGDDTLYGGSGEDSLFGGEGADVLHGGDNNDTLNGNGDADLMFGNTGDDMLNGDDGSDIIYGGSDNDTQFGGNGDDYVSGEDGNDLLHGNAGNDRIIGGNGNDTMYGGDGDDIMKGQDGDDTMFGEGGNDIMYADGGVDALDGGADNDFLYGGSSNDILDGGTGDDRLRGNLNNDTLNGGEGVDLLFGGGQNDTLNGDAGDDNLRGENGNDILDGGAGDDVLFGNGLVGGTPGDADIFVFKTGNEIDRIRDWEDGSDMIDLTSYGFANAGAALAQFVQQGGNVRFIDGTDELVIEGEILANITAADIMI